MSAFQVVRHIGWSHRVGVKTSRLDGQGVFLRLYAPFHGQRRGRGGSLPNVSDGFGLDIQRAFTTCMGACLMRRTCQVGLRKGRWGGQPNKLCLLARDLASSMEVRIDILLKGLCWRNHGPFFPPPRFQGLCQCLDGFGSFSPCLALSNKPLFDCTFSVVGSWCLLCHLGEHPRARWKEPRVTCTGTYLPSTQP